MGQQYGLKSLSELALAKLRKHVVSDWNLPDFADAAYAAYTMPVPSKSALKMIIVDSICLHAKELLTSYDGKKIREVIAEVPELGLEICVAMTIGPMARKIPEHWEPKHLR